MACSNEGRFKVGQLVWAKMKGYPFWPGLIMDEKTKINMKARKTKNVCVTFFGGENLHAFMGLDDVMPYFKNEEKFSSGSKRRDFLAALEETADYITKNPELKTLEEEFFSTSVPLSIKNENADELKVTDRSKSLVKRRRSRNSDSRRSAKRLNLSSLKSETSELAAASPSDTARVAGQSVNKRVGFIGLGTMGARFVRRLVNEGFNVVICDRSLESKLNESQKPLSDLATAPDPFTLMGMCDVVFSCVNDRKSAREVVFGGNGILGAIQPGKAYVEMTTIDPETAELMFQRVSESGGQFLEAPFSGMKDDADEGRLVFICSGSKALFDECVPFFKTLGRRSIYFGDAGKAAKFRLLYQIFASVVIAGMTEVCAIATRFDFSLYDIDDVLGSHSPMGCSMVKRILKDIIDGTPAHTQRLDQMQGELQMALSVVEEKLKFPASVAVAANQDFLMALQNRSKPVGSTAKSFPFELSSNV